MSFFNRDYITPFDEYRFQRREPLYDNDYFHRDSLRDPSYYRNDWMCPSSSRACHQPRSVMCNNRYCDMPTQRNYMDLNSQHLHRNRDSIHHDLAMNRDYDRDYHHNYKRSHDYQNNDYNNQLMLFRDQPTWFDNDSNWYGRDRGLFSPMMTSSIMPSMMPSSMIPSSSFNKGEIFTWNPKCDVHENDKNYIITYDLPGVKQDDINVTCDNQFLTVSGERKSDKKHDKGRSHTRECTWGTFERSMRLPLGVDPNQVTARFENGVLNVCVPKGNSNRLEGSHRINIGNTSSNINMPQSIGLNNASSTSSTSSTNAAYQQQQQQQHQQVMRT